MNLASPTRTCKSSRISIQRRGWGSNLKRNASSSHKETMPTCMHYLMASSTQRLPKTFNLDSKIWARIGAV